MSVKARLKKIIDALFVDKYNCMICNDELEHPNKYGICPTCMVHLPVNDGKICLKCGKHMKDEADYCLTCQNNDFFFDINRSYFIYKDDIKKLIHGLKFGGKKYVTKYMASYYEDMYKRYDYHADIIVSVPISKSRYKERGYNQSREIAVELSRRLDIPYIEDAVVKVKELRPQEELSGKERIDSVIGAFKLMNIDAIKGKNVLLIDDVLTTGATMSAVALELKKKCGRVECLTFASPEVRYNTPSGNVEEDYKEEMELY